MTTTISTTVTAIELPDFLGKSTYRVVKVTYTVGLHANVGDLVDRPTSVTPVIEVIGPVFETMKLARLWVVMHDAGNALTEVQAKGYVDDDHVAAFESARDAYSFAVAMRNVG